MALRMVPVRARGPEWMLDLLLLAALSWVWLRSWKVWRDDALPALALALSGIGLMLIARLSPELGRRQEIWLFISLGTATAAGPLFARVRRMAAYKYVWILGSLSLFLAVALFGQEVNGARLWIRLGPLAFEPIEMIKLFIVFFMAAYLAETGDVIAAARPWSIRANAKYLGPLVLGWGSSLAILIFERDLGPAVLIFAIFATMLYVATRRIDLIIAAGAALVGAMVWAAHRYPYVATRIAVWRNPDADPLGRGFQTLQGAYAVSAGGWFGTGYTLGHPGFIPDVATDYIHAAWSEEFGFLGAVVLIAAYALLVSRALAVAKAQTDAYPKLLATGLGAMLGFQVLIIVGGVLGLLPLTGITLPFISYGGSSLVSNFLAVGLLWSISSRPIGGGSVSGRSSI